MIKMMSRRGYSMKNYEKTITYQQSKEIYQLTKEFTKKYLNQYKDSRLIDHMNSSGRSMKQNLVEGATRNSVKDYIEFIGFSRASGEELLEDYKDLASDWKIEITKSPSSLSSLSFSPSSREGVVNYVTDLIERTNYLLDRQRQGLESYFIEHGGHTENLAKKRRQFRGY